MYGAGITGPDLALDRIAVGSGKADFTAGFENYEFDIPTATTCDVYGRFLIRLAEIEQSINIVEQCLDKVGWVRCFIEDKKIAWPTRLTIGPDGQGNSPEHIKEIMGTRWRP